MTVLLRRRRPLWDLSPAVVEAPPLILAPKPETAQDIHEFVRAEFREAQKKRSA